MYVIILTLSASFLSTIKALARELPQIPFDMHRVQELELPPYVDEADAARIAGDYIASGRYDRVELIHR